MTIVLNGSVGIPASSLSGVIPDANAPSGSVLQVVQSVSNSTYTTITATSFTATGDTATITVLAGSKVLVSFIVNSSADTDVSSQFALYRNGSSIFSTEMCYEFNSASWSYNTINYLDTSPSTGSNTYAIYAKNTNSGDSRYFYPARVLTLQEITA